MPLWWWWISAVRSQRKKNKKILPVPRNSVKSNIIVCLRIISIQDIWRKTSIIYCPGRKLMRKSIKNKEETENVCLPGGGPSMKSLCTIRSYYPPYPLLQTAQAWIWGKICLSNSRIFWPMKIKNILYMLGKSYKCLFGRKTVPLWRWEGLGVMRGGGGSDPEGDHQLEIRR